MRFSRSTSKRCAGVITAATGIPSMSLIFWLSHFGTAISTSRFTFTSDEEQPERDQGERRGQQENQITNQPQTIKHELPFRFAFQVAD
jgi:hypothetical protein